MAVARTIEELEQQIGIKPNTGSRADEQSIRNMARIDNKDRILLIEWLIKHGIPSRGANSARAESIANAYCSLRYLRAWRNRINPSWALLGGDDENEDAPYEDLPSALQNPVTIPPTSAPAADNKPTELWLKGLFQQVEKAVQALTKQELANAKIDLSEKAKQEIISLAKDSATAVAQNLREEAMQALREALPPRQIEIRPTQPDAEIISLGIQHEKFPLLLQAMQSRDHRGFGLNIGLIGPTGSGKTSAVQAAAKAFRLEFEAESSLDADYKITGFYNAQGIYMPTAFFRRYTQGGVILLDEIDNYSPSALLAVNAATANGFAQFPHGLFERHKDCIIVACANTWGLGATSDYVGRNRLDAASLDRFQPKIYWPYDERLERAVADAMDAENGTLWFETVATARRKAKDQGLKIIISPRATYSGISLLKQGFAWDDVIDMTFAAGISPEQKRAIITSGTQPDTKPNLRSRDAEVIDLLNKGKLIEAISRYRTIHHCDLYEAKIAVEAMPEYRQAVQYRAAMS